MKTYDPYKQALGTMPEREVLANAFRCAFGQMNEIGEFPAQSLLDERSSGMEFSLGVNISMPGLSQDWELTQLNDETFPLPVSSRFKCRDVLAKISMVFSVDQGSRPMRVTECILIGTITRGEISVVRQRRSPLVLPGEPVQLSWSPERKKAKKAVRQFYGIDDDADIDRE